MLVVLLLRDISLKVVNGKNLKRNNGVYITF